jgi:hypothetical protein
VKSLMPSSQSKTAKHLVSSRFQMEGDIPSNSTLVNFNEEIFDLSQDLRSLYLSSWVPNSGPDA